jgi:hypothetical protein
LAPQPLASSGLQELHATPIVPQFIWFSIVTQVLPLQQPVEQLPASQPAQAWLLQVHAAQLAPPVPQAVLVLPLWQTPLESQQPFGHEVALQTQLPFTHTVPATHWVLLPHLQTPVVLPQWSDAPPSHATQATPFNPQVAGYIVGLTHWLPWQQPPAQVVESQTQVPLLHLWPAPHAALLPHLQTAPAAQVLATVVLQGWQV